jgi:hypothetical protein
MKIDRENETKMKRLINIIFGELPSTKLYNNLINFTSLTCFPLLICRGDEDLMKLHYKARMSCIYNDMINMVITLLVAWKVV